VYGTELTAAYTTGYGLYLARVDPIAQTCAWWLTLCPKKATAGWDTYPSVTVSPDGTKLALFGGGTEGNVGSFGVRLSSTGTTTTYTYASNGTTYLNACALILYTANGVPISNGVISSVCSATPAGYTRPSGRLTHAWSPDSSTFSAVTLNSETVAQNWYYWDGAAWVAKASFSSGQASRANVFATLTFPVNTLDTGAWGVERFTLNNINNDVFTSCGAQYAADGNLWTTLRTFKNNGSGSSTVVNYGGNTVTTDTNVTNGIGSMMVFRGKVNPATGNVESVTGMTTTTGGVNSYKVPTNGDYFAMGTYEPAGGNGYMRMVFETTLGSLLINGEVVANTNGGTNRVVVVDFAPNLSTKNAAGYATPDGTGDQVCTGSLPIYPADDAYHSVTMGYKYAWKQGLSGINPF
jgi:hypothetical protein